MRDLPPSNDRPEPDGEERGLLLVDLLRLHRRFSLRRYREDIVGFVLAWLVVAGLLALAWWSVWVGSS
jgi:hypothetical protein